MSSLYTSPVSAPVKVSESALQNQRQGSTILVYSSFPNGNPMSQLDQKQVDQIMSISLPGMIIDPTHLVYGRVQNEKKVDIGAIVYPITESQYRQVESAVQTNKNDSFKTEEEINKRLLPQFIQKDMKGGKNPPLIFDMSRKRLLMPEEVKQLSNSSSATAINTRDRNSKRDDDQGKSPASTTKKTVATTIKVPEAHSPEMAQKRQSHVKHAKTQTIHGNTSATTDARLAVATSTKVAAPTEAKRHAAAAPQQQTHKAATIPYQYHSQTFDNYAYSTEADRGVGPTPNPYKPLLRGQHAPAFPGLVDSWPNGSPS